MSEESRKRAAAERLGKAIDLLVGSMDMPQVRREILLDAVAVFCGHQSTSRVIRAEAMRQTLEGIATPDATEALAKYLEKSCMAAELMASGTYARPKYTASGLCEATHGILAAHGIRTMDDLAAHTRAEVLGIAGIGYPQLDEIEQMLRVVRKTFAQES